MAGLGELEQRLDELLVQEARLDEEKAEASRKIGENLCEVDERIAALQKELSSLYELRRKLENLLREAGSYPASSNIRHTRRIILDYLRRHPETTATEISRDTQLNEPTVQAQLVRAMKDVQVTRSNLRPFRYSLSKTGIGREGEGSAVGHSGHKKITLHEELRSIFLESNEEWLTTKQLAGLVNQRRRYRKKDGSDVTPYQIHGRTKNYEHLFKRKKQLVKLSPK
jgi:hypothetical protein